MWQQSIKKFTTNVSTKYQKGLNHHLLAFHWIVCENFNFWPCWHTWCLHCGTSQLMGAEYVVVTSFFKTNFYSSVKHNHIFYSGMTTCSLRFHFSSSIHVMWKVMRFLSVPQMKEKYLGRLQLVTFKSLDVPCAPTYSQNLRVDLKPTVIWPPPPKMPFLPVLYIIRLQSSYCCVLTYLCQLLSW